MGAPAPVRRGDADVQADVLALRAALDGDVAAADLARPLVVRAASMRDVQLLVGFAARHGMQVVSTAVGTGTRPRGGPDTMLLVDVDLLDRVMVDPAGRRLRAEAGVTWDDVASVVLPHGLTALAGGQGAAGPVGDTLGGGVGWLSRRHGMACNAVLAVEVVTADGRTLRCDSTSDQELFWALRGGGGGLGVVTAVELALLPVSEAQAGGLSFRGDRRREVLLAWRDWTRQLPDAMTSVVRLVPARRAEDGSTHPGATVDVVIEVCLLGDQRGGDELLAPLRALQPDGDTVASVHVADLVRPSSTGSLDGPSAAVAVAELTEDVMDAALAVAGPEEGVAAAVEVRHLGGAMAVSSPDHGALDHLEGRYLVTATVAPQDVAARTTASALLTADRRSRLLAIRAAVDPDGLFSTDHPTPAADRSRATSPHDRAATT